MTGSTKEVIKDMVGCRQGRPRIIIDHGCEVRRLKLRLMLNKFALMSFWSVDDFSVTMSF